MKAVAALHSLLEGSTRCDQQTQTVTAIAVRNHITVCMWRQDCLGSKRHHNVGRSKVQESMSMQTKKLAWEAIMYTRQAHTFVTAGARQRDTHNTERIIKLAGHDVRKTNHVKRTAALKTIMTLHSTLTCLQHT